MKWIRLSQSDSNYAAGKLRYWKEVLPEGSYRKDSENLDFRLSRENLLAVVTESNKAIENGNACPLFNGHDESAEKRLGTVLKFENRTRDAGTTSIFALIEFSDEESKAVGVKNDVSVFIPPRFVDGKGVTYAQPIRHVAVTAVPVIPGLSGYEAIAASFQDTTNSNEVKPMLDSLLKMMGVEVEENATDEQKVEAIGKKYAEQVAKMKELEAKLAAEKSAEKPSENSGELSGEKQNGEAIAASMPAVVIRQLAGSRKTELDALVLSNAITPARRDELAKRFCTDDDVKESLSLSENQRSEFEIVVETIREVAKSLPPSAKGGNSIALDHGKQPGTALLEAAKARRESAKA